MTVQRRKRRLGNISRRVTAAASAATSSIPGVSTTGNSSFGTVLVAGRNRVPRPAAGTTAVYGSIRCDCVIHRYYRRDVAIADSTTR